MDDLDKFIGVRHFFGRSDYLACDCAGLCRLFYREHGYSEALTDGKPENAEEYKEQPHRMLKYLLKNLDKIPDIKDLQYGDIVLTKVMDEHHVAVYLGYNKILTMEIPVIYGTTKSCVYRGQQWMPYFVIGFRRRSL